MSLMLSFSTNGCQTTKWGSYFTYPKSADLLLTELGLKPCQMNINIQLERIKAPGGSEAGDVPALAWTSMNHWEEPLTLQFSLHKADTIRACFVLTCLLTRIFIGTGREQQQRDVAGLPQLVGGGVGPVMVVILPSARAPLQKKHNCYISLR